MAVCWFALVVLLVSVHYTVGYKHGGNTHQIPDDANPYAGNTSPTSPPKLKRALDSKTESSIKYESQTLVPNQKETLVNQSKIDDVSRTGRKQQSCDLNTKKLANGMVLQNATFSDEELNCLCYCRQHMRHHHNCELIRAWVRHYYDLNTTAEDFILELDSKNASDIQKICYVYQRFNVNIDPLGYFHLKVVKLRKLCHERFDFHTGNLWIIGLFIIAFILNVTDIIIRVSPYHKVCGLNKLFVALAATYGVNALVTSFHLITSYYQKAYDCDWFKVPITNEYEEFNTARTAALQKSARWRTLKNVADNSQNFLVALISIFTLSIAISRYLAIKFPIKAQILVSNFRQKVSIPLCCCCALLTSAPLILVTVSRQYSKELPLSSTSVTYLMIVSLILTYYIPFILTCISTMLLTCVLRSSSREMRHVTSREHDVKRRAVQTRVTVMLVTLLISDILLNIVSVSCLTWYKFKNTTDLSEENLKTNLSAREIFLQEVETFYQRGPTYRAFLITLSLAACNNFVIYCIFMNDYRSAFLCKPSSTYRSPVSSTNSTMVHRASVNGNNNQEELVKLTSCKDQDATC